MSVDLFELAQQVSVVTQEWKAGFRFIAADYHLLDGYESHEHIVLAEEGCLPFLRRPIFPSRSR